MAKNFYFTWGLIGGAAGDLDDIDGTNLADGDGSICCIDGNTYSFHLDATSGAAESSPNVISPDTNAGTKRWILQTIVSADIPYIRLKDAKPTSDPGGTFTQDAWQKRICTEDLDTHNLCSVTDSVITLQAGTYDCFIAGQTYDIRRHRLRLRNTTDGITEVNGINNYDSDTGNGAGHSIANGRFNIIAAKNFEIQHYCTYTKADNGFGLGLNTGTDEIYLLAEFKKVK